MQLTEVKKKLKPGSLAEHYIGDIKGDFAGPTIIAVAGIHGNEATGIKAIEHIIRVLTPHSSNLKGRFLGLKGNIAALVGGVRYVNEDMNRLWITSILDKIRRTESMQLSSIDRVEVKKMLQILDPIVFSGEEVIYIDLHTFSGTGGMFSITTKDDKHTNILSSLKVPRIFGIQHTLQGTSMEYIEEAGHIGFAFESGTHGTKEAEDNAFTALLILLESLGVINKTWIPDFDAHYNYLLQKVAEFPREVEFLYKHIIEDEDEFVMNQGFINFDPVKKGDWLATDKNGKILALSDGYILMPLYQAQGNDGFFIVRDCE